MTIWDKFNVDPDQNTQAAPLGAAYNRFTWGNVSVTFRTVMSGIREAGNLATAVGASLKDMAFQTSSAIAITGGNIAGVTMSSTNTFLGSVTTAATVAAEAIKTGVLPLARLPTNLTGKLADGLTSGATQILYNLIYPVGDTRLWWSSSLSGLVWPGVTATWIEVTAARDAVLVGAGEKTDLLAASGGHKIGDETDPGLTSTANGGHTPTINSHALTANELPIEVNLTADSGGAYPTLKTVSVRTALGHAHTAAAVNNHSHTTQLDILRYGFRVVTRTA